MGRNGIKNIALAAMALNHVAIGFLPRQSLLYWVLLGTGYVTMPVMVFFLVRGFYGTRSRKRYAARLAVAALVSQPAFQLYFGPQWPGLNMMFTLLACFGILSVRNSSRMPAALKIFLQAVLALLTAAMDWPLFAAVLTVLFDMSRTLSARRPELAKPLDLACFMALSLGLSVQQAVGIPPFWGAMDPAFIAAGFGIPCIAAPVLAGALVVFAYDPGKDVPAGNGGLKYWFYGFYPAHLFLLAAVKAAMGLM